MKYSYLLIWLFICVKSMAQDSLYKHLPAEDGKVSYTRIIEVDSAKKDQLFTQIKDWSVDAYKNQKAAFQAEDKDAGYIAFKGYLPTKVKYHGGIVKGSSYEVDIYHTLKFYIKEGKVKVVFMDLESLSKDGGSVYLERNGNYTIPKVPVENWTDGYEKLSVKKRDKAMRDLELDADSINKQINSFLDSIEKKIRSGKNAFDF